MAKPDRNTAARTAPGRRVMRIVLVLIGVIAMLGILEAYYRFVYDETDSFGLTLTTQKWFAIHYRYNASRFRDSIDYLKNRFEGKRRITFLGDSFTEGHGIKNVEDRFANRIRKEKDDVWEVHVMARYGMDLGAEIQQLRRMVYNGYELDRVVLVYCLNDIADIVSEWQIIHDRIYKDRDRAGFLVRNSFLINALYFRWKALRDPDISNYYGFLRAAYDGAYWEHQKARLNYLVDFCRSHGGQIEVVLFPFLHRLDREYEYEAAHAKISGFLNERGVPVLDLLQVFRRHAAERLVVGRFDSHPNDRAHEIAASVIIQFLDGNLSVGGDAR